MVQWSSGTLCLVDAIVSNGADDADGADSAKFVKDTSAFVWYCQNYYWRMGQKSVECRQRRCSSIRHGFCGEGN